MKFSLVSALFLAATSVYAQAQVNGISPTRPVQGTPFQAGSTEQITWTADPGVTTIESIELRSGGSTNLQFKDVVATNVDPKLGAYSWNVPAKDGPDGTAVLVFKTNLGVYYSGYFPILPSNPAAQSTSGTSGGSQSTNGTKTTPASSTSASVNASGQTSSTPKSSGAAGAVKASLAGAFGAAGMAAFFL